MRTPDKEQIVFVSSDTSLKSGSQKSTEADQKILDSVRSGTGLITLTPEGARDLAKKAQELFHFFQQQFTYMTHEQASFIRRLKVDENGTWRYVAEACSDAWGGDWGSNQLAGMALCERAAFFFNEDYQTDPWN